MTDNYFKPALPKPRPLKLAIFGPSKSGKTLTALKVMRGVIGKDASFAVADTENGGALEYLNLPDVGEFAHRDFTAPFTAERFAKLLVNAYESGYAGILVDGITPLWDGPGGVQSLVDANDHGYGSGWKVGNPAHQNIIRTIIDCPIHLICTMRSKTAYASEGGNDKFPKKVGLKPVQREGIEYEFRLLGEMDMDNRMRISGRQGFQNRVIEQPGNALGRELSEYLGHVEPPVAGPPTVTTAPPPTGTTPPVTPATDSVPAPVAAGILMADPNGELTQVLPLSVSAHVAAGWTVIPDPTPQSSPVTLPAPVADAAPATETPEPAAAPASVSTPPPTTMAGPTEPSSPATPETTPSTNGNADADAVKLEAGQLQKIVELCQELATMKPDKGDSSWWMEWANRKSQEEYHQDFSTLTRDNAAGLIERIEKTKLALRESA